jgi:hypothetical protein
MKSQLLSLVTIFSLFCNSSCGNKKVNETELYAVSYQDTGIVQHINRTIFGQFKLGMSVKEYKWASQKFDSINSDSRNGTFYLNKVRFSYYNPFFRDESIIKSNSKNLSPYDLNKKFINDSLVCFTFNYDQQIIIAYYRNPESNGWPYIFSDIDFNYLQDKILVVIKAITSIYKIQNEEKDFLSLEKYIASHICDQTYDNGCPVITCTDGKTSITIGVFIFVSIYDNKAFDNIT